MKPIILIIATIILAGCRNPAGPSTHFHQDVKSNDSREAKHEPCILRNLRDDEKFLCPS